MEGATGEGKKMDPSVVKSQLCHWSGHTKSHSFVTCLPDVHDDFIEPGNQWKVTALSE
jgi:hypothetical protein